jgi:hypothetical protein
LRTYALRLILRIQPRSVPTISGCTVTPRAEIEIDLNGPKRLNVRLLLMKATSQFKMQKSDRTVHCEHPELDRYYEGLRTWKPAPSGKPEERATS